MSDFYVYIYLDPRKVGNFIYSDLHFDHEPIYVGKGKGNRKNVHLQKKRSKGLHPFYDKIRKIISCGHEPIIVTIKENLTDEQSLQWEKDTIEKIGRANTNTGPLLNMVEGGTKNPVLMGEYSGMWGKSLFDVWKEKHGEQWAIKRLEEYKTKMSTVKTGCKITDEAKQKQSLKAKQRWSTIDVEQKKKIINSLTFMTDERRKKLSEAAKQRNKTMTGSNHPRSRKVCIEGIKYSSIREVCEKYGFKNHNTVRNRLLSDNYPDWHYLDL